MIIDDMLPQRLFDELTDWCHRLEYGDTVSPVDGVTYPDISIAVPRWLNKYWRKAVADSMDKRPEDLNIHMQFFRLTTANTPTAPHQAHNDISHGQYSSFYYINDKPDDVMGGTAILRHKEEGMELGPTTEEQAAIAQRDTNDYDAWKILKMFFWEPNRCCYYESDMMHRAEPPKGWGQDANDGRLVLITFFSC